jgi:acetolactate synthase-1/2/3 large subunit
MARGRLPRPAPAPHGHARHARYGGAVGALQKSDLIVALSTRFDDRVTRKLDTFAPGAPIVHADIDPAEISKNCRADLPIVGDCREVIADLVAAVKAEHEQATGLTSGPGGPSWIPGGRPTRSVRAA